MNRCTTALVLLVLLTLGGACARAQVWPPPPAALRPGEDSCAECRMIVSDSRFAAQRHSRDGHVEWFDDVGCLVEKYGPGGSDAQGVFVHAFGDEGWVRGDRGYVVHSAGIDSPMGYGWCAFATPEGARGAVRDADSDPLPITDLLRGDSAASSPRPPEPDPKTPQR